MRSHGIQRFALGLAALVSLGGATFPSSAHAHDLDRLEAYQRYMVEEPIGIQRSQTPVGRFNAEVIFLADQIERNADRKSLDNTFVVTSITNLNNLSETTSFGRLLSENLIHELQVRKWKVFEVRLTKDIIVNNTGEFSLSRDIQKIRDLYKIGGIVAGTYSIAEGNIIINVRVVDINSGIIASSGQIRMPVDWFTESLLTANEERQKVMKIVGDSPSRGKGKVSGVDLESSKWIKIEDISR
jgi:TolB-like protein